jgi:hypothetical protein
MRKKKSREEDPSNYHRTVLEQETPREETNISRRERERKDPREKSRYQNSGHRSQRIENKLSTLHRRQDRRQRQRDLALTNRPRT